MNFIPVMMERKDEYSEEKREYRNHRCRSIAERIINASNNHPKVKYKKGYMM